jgi:hypothetical protein
LKSKEKASSLLTAAQFAISDCASNHSSISNWIKFEKYVLTDLDKKIIDSGQWLADNHIGCTNKESF